MAEVVAIKDVIKEESIQNALEIDDNGWTTAKRLYDWLEYDPTHYSRWCQDNIINNPVLEENVDFIGFSHNGENLQGGRPSMDYLISIEVAKEFAMMAKNERGKAARKYFNRVEKSMIVTVKQYNELVNNYNMLSTKLNELSTTMNEQTKVIEDHHLELSARMDAYDFGQSEFDHEKAQFIYDMAERLKEMMPYYNMTGNKYAPMLDKVIQRMEEISHEKFSGWEDYYKDKKHIDHIPNRLNVIAENEKFQCLFLNAYNQMCREMNIPNEANDMMDRVFEGKVFTCLEDFD